MTTTLTRVYDDYATANATITKLKSAGLAASDISILASTADGWHKPNSGDVDPKHDKDRNGKDDRSEGAVAGAGFGAIAGGAVGVAAGLGMLAIPGVGPVVAAGWLSALAAGAVAGGATGSIIGALVESGTSKENAELYAEALRRGGAIVTAKVPDKEKERFALIMDEAAFDVGTRAQRYRSEGWQGFDPSAKPFTPDDVRREREAYRAN